MKENKKALWLSTFAFTVCFAIWTIFSIIGVKLKVELGLSSSQFGLLIATPILTGSLSRLFLGIWTDQIGGRIMLPITMILSGISALILTTVSNYYAILLCALGIGLAGGTFAVGVSYVSKWFDKSKQGTALGFFGMGNVGAAFTSMVAPLLLVMVGGEWQGVAQIYAVAVIIVAVLFFLLAKNDPATQRRKEKGEKTPSMIEQLAPLKELQVWRFSLYYFFVFGAYVALALWLPSYYMGVYGLDIITAGTLTSIYALPGSVFRVLGGWMSDKYGARFVMYLTFMGSIICTFILSYPATTYIVDGIRGPIEFTMATPLPLFVGITIFLGFFMSLGKAAVYKHIPVYYPNHVGAIGGVVGLVGGLGGFFLPIAFGVFNDTIGIWTSCFMILTILITIALVWMHISIVIKNKKEIPALQNNTDLPELKKA